MFYRQGRGRKNRPYSTNAPDMSYATRLSESVLPSLASKKSARNVFSSLRVRQLYAKKVDHHP